MQAMILAAGLGTRLRPLTFHTPKPLFPVLNQPLVERLCISLRQQGFSQIFINTYHLSHVLEQWYAEFVSEFSGLHLIREPELLGTGGGIQNVFARYARKDQPLLVINGDVVTDIDLRQFWECHSSSVDGSLLASLLVHPMPPWNKLEVRDGFVLSFAYTKKDALAFTGISVLSPMFMATIPQGPGSVIAALQSGIEAGGHVRAVMAGHVLARDGGDYIWEDMGTPAGYLRAHGRLIKGAGACILGHGVTLAKDFVCKDWVCIGACASIGQGVRLDRCVVWADTHVPAGTCAKGCILTPYGVLCAGGG